MSRPRHPRLLPTLTLLVGCVLAFTPALAVAEPPDAPAEVDPWSVMAGEAVAESEPPAVSAAGEPAPSARARITGEAPPSRIECPEGAGLASGPPDPALFRDEPDVRIRATWCERYDARGRSMRHGPYLDRYPSGATRTRARYVDGAIQGPIRMWHEGGRPWLAATFVDGELDGPYLMTQPNGHPWYEATYRRGVIEGPVRTWYPDGTLSAETPHAGGVEHGLARTFYPNGQPKTEIEISKGVWNGRFRRWHPNGKLATEGRYAPCEPGPKRPPSCALLGAAREGEWKEWSEPGKLVARQVFRRGERIGKAPAPVAAPASAGVGPAAAAPAPAHTAETTETRGVAAPTPAAVDGSEVRGSLGR